MHQSEDLCKGKTFVAFLQYQLQRYSVKISFDCDTSIRQDSDLEAFSHYPRSVASQHCDLSQPVYQRLQPTVPLVLRWLTVVMSLNK